MTNEGENPLYGAPAGLALDFEECRLHQRRATRVSWAASLNSVLHTTSDASTGPALTDTSPVGVRQIRRACENNVHSNSWIDSEFENALAPTGGNGREIHT